jgi:glycosyltransferase involved in cell wall biosynthesis
MDSKSTKKNLSAVIITKNEAENISQCILALKDAVDEVLVVDSYSEDKTKEICTALGAKVIQIKWMGYAKTKNFANQQAKNDWILSVDADEVISKELLESIISFRNKSDAKTFGIINRKNYFCGKWIKHCGWNPDKKVRVFNKNHARWKDLQVHETLGFNKDEFKTVLLKGDCHHYSFKTVEQHLQQINKYSTLAAFDMYQKGKKAFYLMLILKPFFSFIKVYFLKKGFLDGWRGLIISFNTSFSKYLRIAKLLELTKKKQALND